MTTVWLPGPLLAAPTPSVMAASIDDSAGPVRAALDALYDKTVFASQAEALSGTIDDKAMSPLRVRQAFDNRINGAIDSHQPIFARLFSVNVNNSRTGYADITFPTGMFSNAPVVQVTLYGQSSTLWHTFATTASATGVRIGASYTSDVPQTTTINLSVTATRPRY